ncbi:zinc-binding alcohol dehydrogenase family protein [Thiomonas intermedia]|uniref:zinc-binding alcohol dehydrogenase family protein n=1 Tax=Thiomonas intermedia TaxID=926 RepID=UPI0009A4EDC0|nr:zinc-binding alcohol dehydrogenase family protein [Thiomonas intermedia]
MSLNQAAWINAKGQPLSVSEAPMPRPGAGEILVRNRAIALNSFDGIVQTLGSMVTPWVSYPAILGSDVAGEVVVVGASVSRFKPGDRVLGLALGIDKIANRSVEGAFQKYVILRQEAATELPDSISFERAAVLPLAIATAACGLFLDDQLGLRAPSVQRSEPTGKTVLIWGGSTCVGSAAIQLAVAAGYEVVTTASPKNFDYVRGLGASYVFDYNDTDVVVTMAKHLADRDMAGALAIAVGSGASCIDVMSRCRGQRMVSMASSPLPINDAPLTRQFFWKLTRLPQLAAGFLGLAIRARVRGVATRAIWGTALMKGTLGKQIFNEFLGPALASGRLVPAPKPLVVGHSLEALPEALALLRRGVSASKVVVSL